MFIDGMKVQEHEPWSKCVHKNDWDIFESLSLFSQQERAKKLGMSYAMYTQLSTEHMAGTQRQINLDIIRTKVRFVTFHTFWSYHNEFVSVTDA